MTLGIPDILQVLANPSYDTAAHDWLTAQRLRHIVYVVWLIWRSVSKSSVW